MSTVPEPGLTTTRSRNGTLDAQIAGADIEPVAAPVLLDFKSPTTATHGPNQPEGTPLGASSEEMPIGTTSSSFNGVTKQKTSVTIDREKINEVRRFTGAGSTSAAIDVAVTEFIRLARAHRDVAAYTREPPAADEVAIAQVRPDWSDLTDETDWDSLYGGGAE